MSAQDNEAERLVGSVLGKRFEIVACVEEDEAGVRYEAQDSSSGTPATVRVLHRFRPDDASLKQLVALLTEVSALGIAGVPHLRGVGRTRSRHVYYAIDAVSGQSLNQLMSSLPPGASEAVALVTGVADILELAHGRNVVHGALHPGAIIVDGQGSTQTFQLLDFGLGPLLAGGDVWPTGSQGTVTLYQAPEQAKGEPYDHRADIYALGALLFHLLTGSAPFAGQSPLEILACQLRGEAPSLAAVKPSLEGSPLQALVDQCMKSNPGERFQMLAAFVRTAGKLGRQEAQRKKNGPAKVGSVKGKAGVPGRVTAKGSKKKGNRAGVVQALPRARRGDSSSQSSLLWYALAATLLFGGVAVVGLSAMENPGDSAESGLQAPAPAPPPPRVVTKTPPVPQPKRKGTPFGGVQASQADGGPAANPNAGKGIAAAAEDQAPALSERAAELLAEGNQALDAGQYSRAVARFRSAKRAAPDAAVIARGLGMAYLHSGQTDDAASEFERYLKLQPYAPDGMMIRHTLRQLGALE